MQIPFYLRVSHLRWGGGGVERDQVQSRNNERRSSLLLTPTPAGHFRPAFTPQVDDNEVLKRLRWATRRYARAHPHRSGTPSQTDFRGRQWGK